jgi:hypothetical protein
MSSLWRQSLAVARRDLYGNGMFDGRTPDGPRAYLDRRPHGRLEAHWTNLDKRPIAGTANPGTFLKADGVAVPERKVGRGQQLGVGAAIARISVYMPHERSFRGIRNPLGCLTLGGFAGRRTPQFVKRTFRKVDRHQWAEL